MKALLKLILSLTLVFICILLLMKLTGAVTIEKVENWLLLAKSVGTLTLALIVIAILFTDLILSIPTLATVTLSGYFLGHLQGALASLIGLLLVGITGYIISFYHGEKVEKIVLKKPQERLDARDKFSKHGIVMILFSRAVPMLPEVSACMAGMTQMPFGKFIGTWTMSILPYVLIAAYAGSVSSLDNPGPAIYTAIAINSTLWLGWFITQKINKIKKVTAG